MCGLFQLVQQPPFPAVPVGAGAQGVEQQHFKLHGRGQTAEGPVGRNKQHAGLGYTKAAETERHGRVGADERTQGPVTVQAFKGVRVAAQVVAGALMQAFCIQHIAAAVARPEEAEIARKGGTARDGRAQRGGQASLHAAHDA